MKVSSECLLRTMLEKKKKNHVGTSLVVQWLTLQVSNAGGPGFIPDQGTRAHILQLRPGAAKLKKKKRAMLFNDSETKVLL